MKGVLLTVLLITPTTICNAIFNIDSILGDSEVSLGPYNSNVSIGDVTQTYPHLNSIDLQASENAATLIELLRRMFGVGLFRFPPLDPFTSNKLNLMIMAPGTFIAGKLLLNSLKLTGAKNFHIEAIELRMKTGRVDFRFYIPKLNYSVNFKTDLYLGGLIPLFLKGKLRGRIDELQLSGALQMQLRFRTGFRPKAFYQLSGATIHVHAKDVKVRLLKGLHKNGFLQSIYTSEDRSALSQWLSSTRNMMSKYALNAFISLANEVLLGMSVDQVNAYLVPDQKTNRRTEQGSRCD